MARLVTVRGGYAFSVRFLTGFVFLGGSGVVLDLKQISQIVLFLLIYVQNSHAQCWSESSSVRKVLALVADMAFSLACDS